ncbi:A24 family peptidase [Thiohalomonas denitrificans]|uniref:A24 family peptidase n=1 Tax=Thiohalomonas denitrificans TaxID=415747 RepID=UPI0026F1CDC7|nr:prepilin peptidase [Thiohalomonas denitrificans]
MLIGEIIALSGLLGLAVIEDVKHHRISNRLCVTILLTGLLFGLWGGASVALTERLGGVVIGFAALLPFYALSAMGAGDVKLMAAVGSYLGMAALPAVLLTLIFGGILALAIYLIERYVPVPGALANALIVRESGRLRFPYALAIAAGSAGALWIEVM